MPNSLSVVSLQRSPSAWWSAAGVAPPSTRCLSDPSKSSSSSTRQTAPSKSCKQKRCFTLSFLVFCHRFIQILFTFVWCLTSSLQVLQSIGLWNFPLIHQKLVLAKGNCHQHVWKCFELFDKYVLGTGFQFVFLGKAHFLSHFFLMGVYAQAKQRQTGERESKSVKRGDSIPLSFPDYIAIHAERGKAITAGAPGAIYVLQRKQ